MNKYLLCALLFLVSPLVSYVTWGLSFYLASNFKEAVDIFLHAFSVVNVLLAICALAMSGLCCVKEGRNWFVWAVFVLSGVAVALGVVGNL